MTGSEISALKLTFGIGFTATVLAIIPGIWLGYILARRTLKYKFLIETLVFLPLVLPPVVTGYILIVLLGRKGWIGQPLTNWTGMDIIFSWQGMVIAAAVVGFPLLVRSVRTAMENVDPKLEEAAQTLGHSPIRCFFSITLPLAWPGILTGLILFAARAIGEFGATRMVASNTEGHRTLALEIFQIMETPGAESSAIVRLVLISITLSVFALLLCEALQRNQPARKV